MAPSYDQALYEPSTSLGSAYQHAASAPVQGEMENLENARYLKLAKQKKQPKVEGDKSNDFNEGENVARDIIQMQKLCSMKM